MVSHILKWHFILVVRVLIAALSLHSTTSHGQVESKGAPLPTPSTTLPGANQPSVEQVLVPESVLVLQLAEALNLGPATDSAKAEELLSSLGIEPKNGWIAEYPVTPEILGDVGNGIALASDQGKIALPKDQALKLFSDVKASLGFDIKTGPNPSVGLIKKQGNTKVYIYTDTKGVTNFTDNYDSIPKEYLKSTRSISRSAPHQLSRGAGTKTEHSETQYMAKPNSEVINKQYDRQEPPIVTYYAPPDTYSNFYSWVPYSFWSTGLYFPGYYVLNDFHRRVFFNRQHYYVTHHARNGADSSHSRRVDRVNRNWQGQSKPHGKDYSIGFSSSNDQAGSRAIVKVNPNPNGLKNGTAISRKDTLRKWNLSPEISRTFGNVPIVPNGRVMRQKDRFRSTPRYGGRNLNQPSFNQRSYVPNTPRFNQPSEYSHDRNLRPSRSADGNVHRGYQGGGSFGGFQGSGNFMNQGGRGGGSTGASRGGHR